jgi:hypothetical protein
MARRQRTCRREDYAMGALLVSALLGLGVSFREEARSIRGDLEGRERDVVDGFFNVDGIVVKEGQVGLCDDDWGVFTDWYLHHSL